MDFIPFSKSSDNLDKRADFKRKQGILISPNKALELTTFEIKKKEEFEFFHEYGSKERNVEIIGKNQNGEYGIEVKYLNASSNVKYNSKLSLEDGIILQKIIDYSFPFMLGWHVMNTNNYALEDMM